MAGPNLDNLHTVERKRHKCYGCDKRRMTVQLVPSGHHLCSECMEYRDRIVKRDLN